MKRKLFQKNCIRIVYALVIFFLFLSCDKKISGIPPISGPEISLEILTENVKESCDFKILSSTSALIEAYQVEKKGNKFSFLLDKNGDNARWKDKEYVTIGIYAEGKSLAQFQLLIEGESCKQEKKEEYFPIISGIGEMKNCTLVDFASNTWEIPYHYGKSEAKIILKL